MIYIGKVHLTYQFLISVTGMYSPVLCAYKKSCFNTGYLSGDVLSDQKYYTRIRNYYITHK